MQKRRKPSNAKDANMSGASSCNQTAPDAAVNGDTMLRPRLKGSTMITNVEHACGDFSLLCARCLFFIFFADNDFQLLIKNLLLN